MKSVTVCSYGGCPRLTLKFDSLLHAFLSTRLYRHIRPFPRSCSPTSIPASGGQPRLMDLSLSNPVSPTHPSAPSSPPTSLRSSTVNGRAGTRRGHLQSNRTCKRIHSTWRTKTRGARDPVQPQWKAAMAERRSEAGRVRSGRH